MRSSPWWKRSMGTRSVTRPSSQGGAPSARCGFLVDDRRVERVVAAPDDPADAPAGSAQQPLHLGRRHEQPVEPRRLETAVTKPEPDLAAHASADLVPPVIRAMLGRRVLPEVAGGRDDAASLAGHAVQSPQQPLRLRLALEQAEVVHEHHDRVELAERAVDFVERKHLRAPDAAAPRDTDGEWRDVDRDDGMAPPLELERDAAGAGSDVEDAPAHVPERLPLDGLPATERMEIGGRRLGVDEPVVPFDDGRCALAAVEILEQHAAEDVLIRPQPLQARAAGAATRAFWRSSIRSCADSMPTDSRTRLRGAAKGAFAVEACVIRAGTSIRLSTPPRLSASSHTFVRATSSTASSSVAARKETIPPKSRICRAAMSWPGCSRKPG